LVTIKIGQPKSGNSQMMVLLLVGSMLLALNQSIIKVGKKKAIKIGKSHLSIWLISILVNLLIRITREYCPI
jgi:hypothetical protein